MFLGVKGSVNAGDNDSLWQNNKSSLEERWSGKVHRMDLEEEVLAHCGQFVFADC